MPPYQKYHIYREIQFLPYVGFFIYTPKCKLFKVEQKTRFTFGDLDVLKCTQRAVLYWPGLCGVLASYKLKRIQTSWRHTPL